MDWRLQIFSSNVQVFERSLSVTYSKTTEHGITLDEKLKGEIDIGLTKVVFERKEKTIPEVLKVELQAQVGIIMWFIKTCYIRDLTSKEVLLSLL